MTIIKITVPQKHKSAYDRLMALVPLPFRNELSIQQMILENLLSKGERFITLRIQSAIDQYEQVNKKSRSEQKK